MRYYQKIVLDLPFGEMKVIAHRGASGQAPENSISAVKLALDMGIDFVEVDVRMTGDGRLVLIHDKKIDRVTDGKGYVSKLYFRNIRRFNLTNGEKIPTLEEVLELFRKEYARSRSKLRIHVKRPGYEGEVLDAIVSRGLSERVRIVGRRPILKNFIEVMERGKCWVELGLAGYLQPLKIAKELRAIEVSPHISLLTESYVEKAHKLGMEVFAWTINDLETLVKAQKLGVDGVITDYPDKILSYLKG